jgi:hypothetical protein
MEFDAFGVGTSVVISSDAPCSMRRWCSSCFRTSIRSFRL